MYQEKGGPYQESHNSFHQDFITDENFESEGGIFFKNSHISKQFT